MSLNSIFAKDVAYIVKTLENPNVISVLNELNYTYDIIGDNQIPSANFSNYAILLIQDSVTNKDYLPLNKNLLFINKDYAPLVWTQGTVITGSSNIFSANFDQLGTPFSQGFSNINFDVYTTPKPDYYLHVYPAGITSVVRSTGSTGSYPIVAYSNVNNNRKVFFGFYSINYWSADTKLLFKNSLNWTRLGVDNDKDGYFSDNDCNDNDVLKWRNLPGYLDNDKDNYGTGSLLQVCSGINLPIGYSNVSGDCNDNDVLKWRNLPGYLDNDKDEIGSGNVSQVCSGNSLAEGYSQTGGDCNDNNASLWVNLNAYLDNDKDERGSGNLTKVCTNGSLSEGYSNFGTDCNDEDASIWRLISGYIDSDLDYFGTGNLSDVCSGFNLPPGYASNDLDCNDSDNNINPNMIEIPYDEIDQTCKGYDIADVDEDGYCNTGYLIQNASLQCSKETGLTGTDCNDEDASFNTDSLNETKDCINKDPVIQKIDNIRVKQTEEVVITINASDVDGDELIYYVNDDKFVQSEDNSNVFTWKTNFLDLGNYVVEIMVSDGFVNITENVNIEVVKTNRNPVCEEIPSIEFNEEDQIQINLKDYCYDEDEDSLVFSIANSSSNLISFINNEIVNLSSTKDYFGEQWISFKVSDGLDSIETNKTIIVINPINDAPTFNSSIEEVNFNEGSNLTNAVNLNKYFEDIDSNLSFNVTGNYNLDVRLHNGYVSFYPINNFIGTETVIFSASDEEFTIYSNPVKINVNDINQAPVFNDLRCSLNINEDTNYECLLDASDIENDSFSFSVVSKSLVNCSIDGNTLRYISSNDSNGKGTCTIRVTDNRNASSDKTIEFNIENVNDAPVINDYFPRENSVKLLTNTEKRFVIFSSDVDSNISTTWKVGDEIVGNSSSFNFVRTKGSYSLSAIVSDGEYSATQIWNVVVGDINEFSCSEVNGFVCNENQTCSGQILGVSDTNQCCNVACSAKPPEFKNIKNITVENKTDSIIIKVLSPDLGNKLYFGDEVNSTISVENLLEDMNFDVQLYIYDLTREKVVSKASQDIKINGDSKKEIDFSFKLDEDLREEDNYYIFVRAIGRNNDGNKFYNQMYDKINIERKDSNLVITDVKFNPEYDVVCGEDLNLKVVVENYGKNAQYVTVKIENSELGWSQISESFRVGEYNDLSAEKDIQMQIPSNAKEGVYKIKVSFSNQNNNQIFEKELNIGACKNQLNTEKPIEILKINPSNSEAVSISGDNNNLLFNVVGILSLLMMITILVALSYYMNKIEFNDEGLNEFGLVDVTPKDNIQKVKKNRKK